MRKGEERSEEGEGEGRREDSVRWNGVGGCKWNDTAWNAGSLKGSGGLMER